ncbi:MAG: glycosyltransferase family 2 protein [Desulfovibrionaceae bacterium]
MTSSSQQNNIPILSVIMPIYNVENTIAFALESVHMQKTSFAYEIIIIDDASTDNTIKIVQEYANIYRVITLLIKKQNLGKADSMFMAYKKIMSQYFTVLDGDDFYTECHALQRRFDFLENHPNHFAVGQSCFQIKNNTATSIFPDPDTTKIFYYPAEHSLRSIYTHTSSILYRNYFTSSPPEILQLPHMRGDTALFIYLALTSKKDFSCIPLASSCYNMHGNGIWTSLAKEEKNDLTKKMFTTLSSCTTTENEDNYLEKRFLLSLDYSTTENTNDFPSMQYPHETMLNHIAKLLSEIPPLHNIQKIPPPIITMKNINLLCAGIGKIIAFEEKIHITNKVYKNNCIGILLSGFDVNNKESFHYISSFIETFRAQKKEIYIFSSGIIPESKKIFDQYFNYDGIYYSEVPLEKCDGYFTKCIRFLLQQITHIAPEQLYSFLHYTDCIATSVLQKGIAKEIISLFPINATIALSHTLAVFDSIITQCTTQSNIFSNASTTSSPPISVLHIPISSTIKSPHKHYSPTHIQRHTASHSIPFTIPNTSYKYAYETVIPNMLHHTKGVHFHYGFLSESLLSSLYHNLETLHVPLDNFVYLPQISSSIEDILERKIDIYIQPFPYISIQRTIDLSYLGIPIIDHFSTHWLCSGTHWHTPTLSWKSPVQLYKIVSTISNEELLTLSKENSYHSQQQNTYDIFFETLSKLSSTKKESPF